MTSQRHQRQWRPGFQGLEANEWGEEEEEEESQSSSRPQTTGTGASEHRSKGSTGPPPSYDGSRATGAFEEYRLRAKLWLHTTNLDPIARGPRMLQALTGKAFEAAKHLIEDDNWCGSPDNGMELIRYLSRPECFGKEELESLWSAMTKLFYSALRRSDDDLAAFRTRFEEAVRKVQKHKVELPSEALGFLFLKQAKVDEETMERLVTLTGGSLKLEAVIDGVRKLKMRLLDPDDDKKRHVWLQDQEHTAAEHVQEADVDDEFHVIEDALQDLDSEDPTAVITEDEAKDVLMTLIRQKIARPAQYSYRQVQQTKQDLRNSRGFRSVNTGSEGRHQGGIVRRDIQQLKQITKCRNCGAVGHWHKECPHPKTSNASSSVGTQGPSTKNEPRQGWWSLVEAVEHEQGATSSRAHE